MNFSLKKTAKTAPPRVKLGEIEQKKEQPQKVRQVEDAQPKELAIKLESNAGWLLSASGRHEKRAIDLDLVADENPHISKDVLGDIVYAHNVQEHPDAPLAQEYDELSVDDFGAALLRGLGREPEKRDSGLNEPDSKQRPALLGIGAKSAPGNTSNAQAFSVPLTKRRKRNSKPQMNDGDKHT